MSQNLSLAQGLALRDALALRDIVQEIAGQPLRRTPMTAPLMLFSHPLIKTALPLPDTDHGDILIQDYQSLSGELDPGTPLAGTATRADKGATTEFKVELSQGVTLRTAIRRIKGEELAASSPLPAKDSGEHCLGPLHISTDHVRRYVILAGDPNPVHQDQDFARGLGLSAPIVPGALLMALSQPSLENSVADIAIVSARARFIAPLAVGAPIDAFVKARGAGRYRVTLMAKTGAVALIDMAGERRGLS